jgi:hypothetical protein
MTMVSVVIEFASRSFNFMFHSNIDDVRSLNNSKKSLKIPKGQYESVNQRRTDNTMTKRKRTKGQTMVTTQTTKDCATRITQNKNGES